MYKFASFKHRKSAILNFDGLLIFLTYSIEFAILETVQIDTNIKKIG